MAFCASFVKIASIEYTTKIEITTNAGKNRIIKRLILFEIMAFSLSLIRNWV